MTPKGSPYFHGLNKITMVQLNNKYRIVPDTADLDNVFSQRDVNTRIITPDRVQMTNKESGEGAPTILWSGLLFDIGFNEETQQMLWFEPGAVRRNVCLLVRPMVPLGVRTLVTCKMPYETLLLRVRMLKSCPKRCTCGAST